MSMAIFRPHIKVQVSSMLKFCEPLSLTYYYIHSYGNLIGISPAAERNESFMRWLSTMLQTIQWELSRYNLVKG